MADVMAWLVNMRKLDQYNIKTSYDRWAEEVQALLAITGVSKALKEKGDPTDETAKAIIMLSIERDLRDYMAGKVSTSSAVDLWAGVKKAKKVLEDEEKAAAARSPRNNLANDFGSMSVAGSSGGGSGWT